MSTKEDYLNKDEQDKVEDKKITNEKQEDSMVKNNM